MSFNDLKIKTKLNLLLGVSVLSLLGVAAVGYQGVKQVAADEQTVYVKVANPSIQLAQLFETVGRVRVATRDAVYAGDAVALRERAAATGGEFARLDSLLSAYASTLITEQGRAAVAQAQQRLAGFHEETDRALERAAAGDRAGAIEALHQGNGTKMVDVLASTLEIKAKVGEDLVAHGEKEVSRAIWLLLGIALAGLFFIALVSLLVSRRVVFATAKLTEYFARLKDEDLAEVQKASQALARGDVSVRAKPTLQPMSITARDEYAQLGEMFNHMVAQLHATMGAFSEAQNVIGSMVTDTETLVEAAKRGGLRERANAGAYQGSYRELVGGVNELLETVVDTFGRGLDVLKRVAERDLTARMDGEYEGSFAIYQETVNTAVENMEEALSQVATGAEQVASRPRARSARARRRWRRGQRSRRARWRR